MKTSIFSNENCFIVSGGSRTIWICTFFQVCRDLTSPFQNPFVVMISEKMVNFKTRFYGGGVLANVFILVRTKNKIQFR